MNLESMNTQQAWDLVGGLSKPSKMPVGLMGCQLKNAKPGLSSGRSRARHVMAATP